MLLSSTQEIKIVRRIFGPAVVVAAIAILSASAGVPGGVERGSREGERAAPSSKSLGL
jgi:hypothetical protein